MAAASGASSSGNDEVDDLFSRFMSEVTISFLYLLNCNNSLLTMRFLNLIAGRNTALRMKRN